MNRTAIFVFQIGSLIFALVTAITSFADVVPSCDLSQPEEGDAVMCCTIDSPDYGGDPYCTCETEISAFSCKAQPVTCSTPLNKYFLIGALAGTIESIVDIIGHTLQFKSGDEGLKKNFSRIDLLLNILGTAGVLYAFTEAAIGAVCVQYGALPGIASLVITDSLGTVFSILSFVGINCFEA
jgi:hypothetical protein